MYNNMQLCLLGIFCCQLTFALIVEDNWKIYYDISTNKSIETMTSTNPRLKLYRQTTKQLRIGFGPIPCTCQDLTCGCCAGMNIQMLNFNRHACMNFTYDPREFAIVMNMLMDNRSLYTNSISGKNPPPACLPVPIPYIPSIDFCVRFFNIHTPGYNIFMCIDFETRMERAPLLVLHFDCLQMGQDGISYHKPEDADYAPEGDTPTQQEDEQIIEIYDEVVEESANITKSPGSTSSMESETMSVANGTDASVDITNKTLATTALPTTTDRK